MKKTNSGMRIHPDAKNKSFQANNGTRIRQPIEADPHSAKCKKSAKIEVKKTNSGMRIHPDAKNKSFQTNNGTRIRQPIEVDPHSANSRKGALVGVSRILVPLKMGSATTGAKCMLIIK
ncbi:hypothetical protein [Virgibacillus sp. JSM 102003]|uniref:hypothetical protein n=1 Tax=Virgibacillus sp. JSM 102003 TaxID=1562108 RepID=UPI0035C26C05